MKFIKQIERFQKIDEFIKVENTGTPIELASRLEISRSHLYRLLDTLKDYGAEVDYSRKIRSFYYVTPFDFSVIVPYMNVLSDTKKEAVNAGFSEKTIQSFFMRRNDANFTSYFAQNRDISYECL